MDGHAGKCLSRFRRISDLQPGQPVGEGERYDLIGCSAHVGRIHEVGKRDAFPLVPLYAEIIIQRIAHVFPVGVIGIIIRFIAGGYFVGVPVRHELRAVPDEPLVVRIVSGRFQGCRR